MARAVPGSAKVSFYGRTYLDVQVQVPVASLAAAKGKVDARIVTGHGGFACNAARAICGRFAPDEVRVVTATSWLGWPLLRASLPGGIALDAIVTGSSDPLPPISVIVDPARACRIFRDRSDHDAAEWKLERVTRAALSARLHVAGRLPPSLAAELLETARGQKARVAWCGGDSLPVELERECDLLCVNSAEAGRLVGESGWTPRQLAEALAKRARVRGAVRLVTGGGKSPAAAAFRDGRAIRCIESKPASVAPERITRLLGVGDAFAAHFLVEACFDAKGTPRPKPDVARGLAAAQRAAGRFITAVTG